VRLPLPPRLRRIANSLKPALSASRRAPRHTVKYVASWARIRGFLRPATMLPRRPARISAKPLAHIASLGVSNAGDTVLPVVLRDLFDQRIGGHRWELKHAHDAVDRTTLDWINRSGGLVIGGGGLFLSDTNKNSVSGWQWPASAEAIRSIDVPTAVFAVGYNRFRGQGEFDPVFTESLTALVEKSAFVGLRNHGSIAAIREYLPEELRSKVTFQPCMTTLIGEIYPERTRPIGSGVIALNCAFDRSDLRLGGDSDGALEAIGRAAGRLAKTHELRYYSHLRGDLKFLPVLDRLGVPYTLVNLSGLTPDDVLAAYAIPDLAIGMRGHAQMIPFGMGVPILSLVTHNKMRWFLEDIEHPEWAIEVPGEDLENEIVTKASTILADPGAARESIIAARSRLLAVTEENLAVIGAAFA
jgi:polysaccharide pyruvyl transferase WcaK-like protein